MFEECGNVGKNYFHNVINSKVCVTLTGLKSFKRCLPHFPHYEPLGMLITHTDYLESVLQSLVKGRD